MDSNINRLTAWLSARSDSQIQVPSEETANLPEAESRVRQLLNNSVIPGTDLYDIETRLSNELKAISEVHTTKSQKEDVLNKSLPEHNLSGYRAGDERLINYWEVKRGHPLVELYFPIEIDGQQEKISMIELYQLTQVCFLPFLIFADLGVLRNLSAGFEGHIDMAALQQQLDQVYLKKVSNDIGLGLFAKRCIKKGAIVGEYTGVVRDVESGGNYCMEYTSFQGVKLVVDAKYFGNQARFINHANQANLEAVERGPKNIGYSRILFKAKRDINADEQLTIDYGSRYWHGKAPSNLE